jgi:hypothetical protein
VLSLGHRVDWDLLFLRQPTVEDLEGLVVVAAVLAIRQASKSAMNASRSPGTAASRLVLRRRKVSACRTTMSRW